MKHLTTEELLLHCDGELPLERARHADECAQCSVAVLDVQAVLLEVERELHASIPPEPLHDRIASREALERALYTRKPAVGFPVGWPAIYAVAASLTIAVFAGYLSSRNVVEEPPARLAMVEESSPLVPEPAVEAARDLTAIRSEPGIGNSAGATGTVARNVAPPTQPGPRMILAGAGPQAIEEPRQLSAEPAPEVVMARFEGEAWSAPPAGIKPTPQTLPPPEFSPQPVSPPRQLALNSPVRLMPPPEPAQEFEPVSFTPPSPPLSAEAASSLIEGHWILTRAQVWQEDVHPRWMAGGLRFEGTVEDEDVRERVIRSVTKRVGPADVSFALALRSTSRHTPGAAETHLATVIDATDRPSGGAVRKSLMGHFSDAARRSFRSPEAALLEAELDRYVSDVLRSQTELMAHVYALNRLLERLDSEHVTQVPSPAASKLRDVVRFHLRAVGEQEAHIYDRLSEALPRRFWSYRGAKKDGPAPDSDWQNESEGLLRETLQLDANLTALLTSPPATVDASEMDLSCGELLHRIRTRVRRIRDRAQALR